MLFYADLIDEIESLTLSRNSIAIHAGKSIQKRNELLKKALVFLPYHDPLYTEINDLLYPQVDQHNTYEGYDRNENR